MGTGRARHVLVAAGGTGGHLFPAEALAASLARRGIGLDLATDRRAAHYGGNFPARATHIIPSSAVRGRDPFSLAATGAIIGGGVIKAWALLLDLNPVAVVGFGGYPTIPPLVAARLRGIPSIIHEQNAVMGRANRFLAKRVTSIATGFRDLALPNPKLAAKTTWVGNPVRPAVILAAAKPYVAPESGGPLRLLVFGGSQGARVMAEVVPAAIRQIEPALWPHLKVTQQARDEDIDEVRKAYAELNVAAEVEPFFPDLPARIAAAHLVISRSGASSVAELAAIGRPAVLVPLPNALDQDQLANAGMLQAAGGALRLTQNEFTAARLASEISGLVAEPQRLAAMAANAKKAGTLDAAERLADLVLKVAKG
jgi:UDP-N-acetylglucosamine--N-acetylmuramyl-(pentapeptide) pyrophosphoryl-undecaprenol N-acetylglucosamine transferase